LNCGIPNSKLASYVNTLQKVTPVAFSRMNVGVNGVTLAWQAGFLVLTTNFRIVVLSVAKDLFDKWCRN
jgi:hypothetical protein